MLTRIYFILIIISNCAFSSMLKEFGLAFGFPSVETEIMDKENNDSKFKLSPNVTGTFQGSISSADFSLGLSLPFGDPKEKNLAASSFEEYYIKGFIGTFEFRVSYSFYRGAFSNIDSKKVFYSDYKQKGINLKATKYFDEKYSKELQFKRSKTSPTSPGRASSLILSYFYDNRFLRLPSSFSESLSSHMRENNIALPRKFKTDTYGVLLGLDGLANYRDFFFRGKASLGLSLQVSKSHSYQKITKASRIVIPNDIDFTAGYHINNNNKVVINTDFARIPYHSGKTQVSNTVIQASLTYFRNI